MASDILREASACNAKKNSLAVFSRLSHFRDPSPASTRSRSSSLKRKDTESSVSYANAAKKRFLTSKPPQEKTLPTATNKFVISAENLETMEVNSAKVASICEKLHSAILAIPEENPICLILRDFCEIVHAQNASFTILATSLRHSMAKNSAPPDSNAHSPEETAEEAGDETESEIESDPFFKPRFVSLGAIPKARNLLNSNRNPRTGWKPTSNPSTLSASLSQPPPKPLRETLPSARFPPEIQNFRDAIKEAEKSTLIFNLDMGRVPLINQTTIGVKATTLLTSMAAVAEGRPPSNPSNESVALIDDVLSVAESISFFSAGTKSVTNKGALSGSFCSIPVCFTFKDKETRFRAEQALRSRCKVSCATPYPPAVRDCVKAAIAAGKAVRPDDFVRVQIDLPKLGMKLAWKPRGNAAWISHGR